MEKRTANTSSQLHSGGENKKREILSVEKLRGV